MSIPSLKKVNIAENNLSDLSGQLDLINFDNAPVAISISHIKDQYSVVQKIEEYIVENNLKLLPYPVCLITNENIRSNSLIIIKETKEAPRFFLQKIKSLNLKENAILKKISLLQTKIRSTNISQSKETFKNYSQATRRINKLQRQSSFINEILTAKGDR